MIVQHLRGPHFKEKTIQHNPLKKTRTIINQTRICKHFQLNTILEMLSTQHEYFKLNICNSVSVEHFVFLFTAILRWIFISVQIAQMLTAVPDECLQIILFLIKCLFYFLNNLFSKLNFTQKSCQWIKQTLLKKHLKVRKLKL